MNQDSEYIEREDIPQMGGYNRCIELTKGFERAGPESGDITRGKLIWSIHISITFTFIMFVLVALLISGSNLIGSSSFFFIAWLLFVFLLFLGAVLRIWETREMTGGLLNRLYYKLDSLIDTGAVEGEKILASLIIRKSHLSFFPPRNNILDCGLCIITTHRAVLIEVKSEIAELDKTISSSRPKIVESFDYSSPVFFYPASKSTGLIGKWNSARFTIKTDGSDIAEQWDFMPIDGNNWHLLEAILERRSRISYN